MKHLRLILVALAFMAWGNVSAQTCDLHFSRPVGAVYEYEVYNRKGELQATTQQEVVSVAPAGRTMRVQTTFVEHNTTRTPITYTITCSGQEIKLDVQCFLPPASDDGQWELRSTKDQYLTYPAALNKGLGLPETTFEVEGYQAGSKAGTLSMRLYNRRVAGQESITVPAGTFTAWVIESDVTTVWKKEGGRPYTFESTAKEYYAPGLGWLKTANFRKNGKALGFTQLKAYK